MSRAILGIQPVREAIRVHGAEIERIFVQQAGGPTLEGLIRFAEGRGVTVELVSRGDLDRRAAGGRHQGAIALAPELRLVPLEALEIGPTTLLVALDGVMDPQNFGAVIRSAVALGASAILWPEHSSAPLSAATFRASAGAIEHAALCRVAALPRRSRRSRRAASPRSRSTRRARWSSGPSICAARWRSSSGPRTKACGARSALPASTPRGCP